MANKTLFQSQRGAPMPKADAINEAGGVAYEMTPEHALAQYATTGCLSSTYYATAEDQLQKVLALVAAVDAEFVAKTAVYARQQCGMKDMPAVLCAALSMKDVELLRAVFPKVMNDARMVRNFVQVLRSGVVGRKSLGTVPKKLVQRWMEAQTGEQLFKASVGNAPSLADLIKMVHPKPQTPERAALYGYLLGRPHDVDALPDVVRQYERFKAGERAMVPDVPFQMLTSLELGPADWRAIAEKASWQMTRMNLNTFARHGVFAQASMVETIVGRLSDAAAVKRARAFPYQLLMAYKASEGSVPDSIRDALQDAMEVATRNVPRIEGKVYVCPDVSGSMGSPVTGQRRGATSAVRCIDVAALVAACILRQNPKAQVMPFESDVVDISLNGRDSVMTNAQKLAAIGGGGTNCSAPLARLNREKARADLVVFVSDNESWMDSKAGRGTATMKEWLLFKKMNPHARLVCIDLQPYGTVQAVDRPDILNVGGFSDQVFEVVAAFAEGRLSTGHWVGEIKALQL